MKHVFTKEESDYGRSLGQQSLARRKQFSTYVRNKVKKSRREYAKECRSIPPNSDSSRNIILTQGKFAIVDSCDFRKVIRFKWCYNGRYACTNRIMEGSNRLKTLYLHEFLFEGIRPSGFRPHHIDENKLNCRRSNLILTHNSTHMRIHHSDDEIVFRFPRLSKKEKLT